MLDEDWSAARRRREPIGWTPVERSCHSSLRVVTRLGSRVWEEGGGASLYLEVVVVRPRDVGQRAESRLAPRRRHRNAGRTMYIGVVMPVVDLSLREYEEMEVCALARNFAKQIRPPQNHLPSVI